MMTIFSVLAVYNPRDMEQGTYGGTFYAKSVEVAEHSCRVEMMLTSASDALERYSEEEQEQIAHIHSIAELKRLEFLTEEDAQALADTYHDVEIIETLEGVNIWSAAELLKAAQAALEFLEQRGYKESDNAPTAQLQGAIVLAQGG